MRRAVAAAVALGLVVPTSLVSGCWRDRTRPPTAGGERPAGAPDPPTDATRREAREWDRRAESAFDGFDAAVRRVVTGAQEWVAGSRPPPAFARDVAEAEKVFLATRDAVSRLPRLSFAPEVNNLYGASVRLYLETARVYEATLATNPLDPDLRTQLHFLAGRLRLLADRTFDRAYALLDPHIGEEESDDVDVRLPDEVPHWDDQGLAPGPPLDDPPRPPPGGPPALRQPSRPEQPLNTWLDAVAAVNVGDASPLADAIDARDAARLRDESRRLAAAAEALRHEPDPRGGGRELSARLRLALLVHADAGRAAQAAALLADPGQGDALASIARRVAAAGDLVWPVPAGVRSSGFPADAEEGA